MKYVQRGLAVLFVVGVPLLFICSSVTYAFNEMRLYSYGFDKYDISQRTGISDEGLRESARTIRDYFNSPSSPLVLRAEVYGEERELFTEREIIHMEDVKRLLWGVYGLGAGAMAYLLAYAGISLWRRGRGGVDRLAKLALWGSEVTLAFVVGVGLFSLVGFDSLFLFFHEVSFGQRLLEAGPQPAFFGDDVPAGVLAGCHAVRGDTGGGEVGGLGGGLRRGATQEAVRDSVALGEGKSAPGKLGRA